MRKLAFTALLLIAAALVMHVPAPAQDIVDRIISVPAPEAFTVQGLRNKPKARKDASVQGEKSLRIAVPGRSDEPWSVAASTAITKPVKAGDALVLAFWARLEKGEKGAASATLPYNAVQQAAAPYTALFTGPATIGPEWKLHELRGKADRDYAAGELNVSIHLATAKQTVDLGPIFVVNMGQ